jgi:hypothetical protein
MPGSCAVTRQSRFVPFVSMFVLRTSVAGNGISKTSHGFARIFTDASQEVYQPCHDWLDAQDTRWVAPFCVVGELKKLKTENGSDADMILFTSYPCLIRAHPWLENDLENQPRIRTDLHGCEPRSISALFLVGLLLLLLKLRDGWHLSALWWELKKLNRRSGSPANLIQLTSYPCLICEHPWREKGFRKAATDSHRISRMRVGTSHGLVASPQATTGASAPCHYP